MTPPRAQAAVTVRTFSQLFSATRRGARLARRLAACQLDEWGLPYGEEATEAVVLVVAELSANAVLHGRVPGRSFSLRLAYDAAEGFVRVEVADAHHAPPVKKAPADDADGGRGLVLVQAVAACWGVKERSGPGKVVWAEVPVPSGPATYETGGLRNE
ncbi:ATP-binding protein [Streptomyces sp. NPDC003077]|uniref:ATP-binding protein n=1 Tax=Streptomyces sp. NPDC003077 TaxID=3154443 RepID=UPI00339EE4D6